jgi:uridylate kinase
MLTKNIKYKRILIKLSGESLMGLGNELFDYLVINKIIEQIRSITTLGVEVAIVIGGGNIFRGVEGGLLKIDKINSDYMGMIATIINGIALNDFFNNSGLKSTIFSAIPIAKSVKAYMQNEVLEALDNKNIVIFAGGIGSPLFTTDSAAALRAIEIRADLIIKATKVDGIYNEDPNKNPNAIKYNKITFLDAINKNLKIMDQTAFTLCKEHNVGVLVCNIFTNNVLTDIIINDKDLGTLVTN